MATIAELGRDDRNLIPAALREAILAGAQTASVEVAPGIFRTPGVCGGDACIRSMRHPVWHLEVGRRMGISDADQLAGYPGLNQSDLDNAWAYAAAHREEIDRAIRENELAGRIVSTPDTCFGAARIDGTRVPVWVLESYRRFGNTDAELLEDYPTIAASDLEAAWEYADSHREEIDGAIRRNRED